MKGNYKLGEAAGIGVYLHWSFVVFAIGMFFLLLTQGASLTGAVIGIGLLLAVFGFVILHEYGHALMARVFGIPTRDITLYPIGGVARLQDMPRNPSQELWIALAGPAVNVALAVIIAFFIIMTGNSFAPVELFAVADTTNLLGGILSSLFYVNVALVVFNMLPAFPMDGGRVLRSILAMNMEYRRATRIASRVGQGMAIMFGLIGLIAFNPVLILIAFFVYMGAGQEARMVDYEDRFRAKAPSFGGGPAEPSAPTGNVVYYDPTLERKVIVIDYKPQQ